MGFGNIKDRMSAQINRLTPGDSKVGRPGSQIGNAGPLPQKQALVNNTPLTGLTQKASGGLAPRMLMKNLEGFARRGVAMLQQKEQGKEKQEIELVVTPSTSAPPRPAKTAPAQHHRLRPATDKPPAYDGVRLPGYSPAAAKRPMGPRPMPQKSSVPSTPPPSYGTVMAEKNSEAAAKLRTSGAEAPFKTMASRPPARNSTLPNEAPVRGGLGHIKHMGDFLNSKGAMETSLRGKVFNKGFQERGQWSAYMGKHLKGGSVTAQLGRPANEWTHESFQAMFMTAWMNHPTEKGAYTVSLTDEQAKNVKAALEEHCDKRVSSHFSTKGFSASKGTTAFKGYGEMLCQLETVEGKPVLFLKMEGHKTDLHGFIGHGQSWIHKIKTGEGLTANEDLKALAKAAPGLVEPRAAENYTNSYKKLLTNLGLQEDKGMLKGGYKNLMQNLGLQEKDDAKAKGLRGKMVPAREMTAHLLVKSNFEFMHPQVHLKDRGMVNLKDLDLANADNEVIGQLLELYIADAKGPKGDLYRMQGAVTDKTLSDLNDLAQDLIKDGNQKLGRVHREVARSPAELDMGRDDMMGPSAQPNAAGDLIQPGNSLGRSTAVRRESRNSPSPTSAYPSESDRPRRGSV
jgi:hypothetical protein